MRQVRQEKHLDSTWITSQYEYKGRTILIKAKKGKGIKCHVLYPDSDRVEFTLRYIFIRPERLLEKAKNKIDAADRTNCYDKCPNCKETF